jgi:mannitol/fructose-specific phosphotransferase system IIA component (Ntr-type)
MVYNVTHVTGKPEEASMLDLTRTMESGCTKKEELLRQIINRFLSDRELSFRKRILKECLRREKEASTLVGRGIAFPHAVIREQTSPGVFCCLATEGVPWNSGGDEVTIVILLICHEENHLPTLSELASILQMPGVPDRLLNIESASEMGEILQSAQRQKEKRRSPEKEAVTLELLENINRLHRGSPGMRIVLFSNSLEQITTLGGRLSADEIILVSSRSRVLERKQKLRDRFPQIIEVSSIKDRSTILKRLWTDRILKEGDLVLSLWGFEFDDMAHSISLSSVPRDLYEEARVLNYAIPHDVNLEILSRAVYLASELSRQGREGKPAGTIFVVGDYGSLKGYCRQLIINPFGGLEDHERSILDPSLSETIKEFSKIDGAYIIDNSGKVISGGTYLSIPPHRMDLEPGLGARHAAALGITMVAPVASVVISESTGHIRVFWDGAEQDIFIPSE